MDEPDDTPETFEQKVLFRLGFIAWSTGIVALAAVVGVISLLAR